MARWLVAYANVGGAWQPAGQGWEGYGGEAVAPIAAMQGGNPVYLYAWDPDTGAWSGSAFDAQASARARPRVTASLYSRGGNYLDSASLDSLLWGAYRDNIASMATQRGLGIDAAESAEGLTVSRNVLTQPDAQAWIADVAALH